MLKQNLNLLFIRFEIVHEPITDQNIVTVNIIALFLLLKVLILLLILILSLMLLYVLLLIKLVEGLGVDDPEL